MKLKAMMMCVGFAVFAMPISEALAKTVQVTLHAKEVDLPIDNKGTMYKSWTFDGEVPGPLVRVNQGDTVEFTLINSKDNKNSHSIDFHASQLAVVENFGQIKPGETKTDRKSTRLNSSH